MSSVFLDNNELVPSLKKNQVVRESSTDLAILAKTDLIFVCTPIASILTVIEKIIPYLSPQTIITDVASVKKSIVFPATQLWKNFVGSHPMAGTAHQGIEAAQKNLFQNAPCVITPLENTETEAIKKVSDIWQEVGCRISHTTPEIHDRAVAWISHLPVIISANLIDSCISHDNQEVVALAKKIASSGFRDTSRVGGGNIELGLMMAQYNRDELLNCLQEYQDKLKSIIKNIEQEDWGKLEAILQATQEKRGHFID